MDSENRGSKSNLNESVLPLLGDANDMNKEKIEMKENSSSPKTSNDSNEHTNDDQHNDNSATNNDGDDDKKRKEDEKERKRQKKLAEEERKKQMKLEKQKQKEEEKEKKKQQKAEKKASMEATKGSNGTACSGGGMTSSNHSSCNIGNRLNQFTFGINLLDRDEHSINDHVNIGFEDIIGEPDATQGFDTAYQLSYGLFQFVRFWIYRILMAIFSLPLALIWALVFTALSLLSIWIVTPGFRVLDILFFYVHRIWTCLIRTFLDPIFQSISLIRQSQPKSYHPQPINTNSGRPLSTIIKNGVKYNKIQDSSADNDGTYKTTANNLDDQLSDQEQVTVTIG